MGITFFWKYYNDPWTLWMWGLIDSEWITYYKTSNKLLSHPFVWSLEPLMFPIGSDLTKRIIFYLRSNSFTSPKCWHGFVPRWRKPLAPPSQKKTKRKIDEIILLPFLLLWLDVRWQKNLVTWHPTTMGQMALCSCSLLGLSRTIKEVCFN